MVRMRAVLIEHRSRESVGGRLIASRTGRLQSSPRIAAVGTRRLAGVLTRAAATEKMHFTKTNPIFGPVKIRTTCFRAIYCEK